jgi:hypothetical protein
VPPIENLDLLKRFWVPSLPFFSLPLISLGTGRLTLAKVMNSRVWCYIPVVTASWEAEAAGSLKGVYNTCPGNRMRLCLKNRGKTIEPVPQVLTENSEYINWLTLSRVGSMT